MKQVVIVAPSFPPSNLTAGHRSRYFAMHLPKFGWKAKVLSVDPRYYEEALDREIEALLPADLEVIRTKAFGVRPFRVIGDIGIRSLWWHYRALCKLIKMEKIDLVYIPMPPNYSAVLGPLVHRKFGVPYAVDYIDPWVHKWPGCEKPFSKAWLSYNLSRFLEPIALKHVSLITAVAPGYYEETINRYKWLKDIPRLAIPYGAEEKDFQYLDQHPRRPYLFDPDDGDYHIIYAGAMLPRAYETLEALFRAVVIFKRDYPEFGKRIKFNFIGTGTNQDGSQGFTIKPIADKFNVSEHIFENPQRIPYLDVLNHLKWASAVLILGSSEAHYTPSKVFQAVLSRRPVIAVLHSKSTAVNILKEIGMGNTVTFNEERPAGACVNEIINVMRGLFDHTFSLNETGIKQFQSYSAETMAQKLAKAFNGVCLKDSGGANEL